MRLLFRPVHLTKNQSKNPEAITIPSSKFNVGLNGIGRITALTPRTKNMLKMFEPTAFPMAMAEFFFVAAIIGVTSSGNEVAPAINVKPITD